MGRYLLFFQLNDQPLITLSTLPNVLWGNLINNNILSIEETKSTKMEQSGRMITKCFYTRQQQLSSVNC